MTKVINCNYYDNSLTKLAIQLVKRYYNQELGLYNLKAINQLC